MSFLFSCSRTLKWCQIYLCSTYYYKNSLSVLHTKGDTLWCRPTELCKATHWHKHTNLLRSLLGKLHRLTVISLELKLRLTAVCLTLILTLTLTNDPKSAVFQLGAHILSLNPLAIPSHLILSLKFVPESRHTYAQTVTTSLRENQHQKKSAFERTCSNFFDTTRHRLLYRVKIYTFTRLRSTLCSVCQCQNNSVFWKHRSSSD